MSNEDQKSILSWIKWGLGIMITIVGIQASFTFANTSKIAKIEAATVTNKENAEKLEQKFIYWLEMDDINNSAIIAHLEGDTKELERLMDESRRVKLRIIRGD